MANIDQVQLPDGSQYRIIDDTSGYATTTYVQDQIATINKNTIGLGNVDNTADINKPVSLLQQAALNEKVDDDIVAYVEGDTTATKRHEVGDQFILNGVLYTATAIIAVNDTIVIGTNCDSAESVATQITENANAIVSLRSDITSINQTGTTATQAIPSGTYFYLNGVLVRAKTAIASGAIFTENTNYEVVTDGGLNEGITYSTSEHIVGKWIDGSVLYEKTCNFGTLPNTTYRSVAHNISNLKRIISMSGYAYGSNGNTLPIPYSSESSTGANISLYCDDTYINITTGSNRSAFTESYITLRYTKTS